MRAGAAQDNRSAPRVGVLGVEEAGRGSPGGLRAVE